MNEEARPLPHSLDAERALLGALLLNPGNIDSVAAFLGHDAFHRDAHARLFKLLLDMSEEGMVYDTLAVVDRVVSSGEEDAFGGIAYISSLPEQVPSTENVEYYARIVHEKAVRRRLLKASQAIAESAVSDRDLVEVLDNAEQSIFEVGRQSSHKDWHSLSEVIDVEFKRIQNLSERRGDVTGVTSGFIDLDRLLAGFQPSDLVILAARPAMGKTALALNFIRNAAMGAGVGGGLFSLEMSRGQLVTRMLCAEARVDASKVRSGYLSKEKDWPRLIDAAERIYQAPIFIDDTPGLTIAQVRSRARRLKAERPELGLIAVDYLQLMQGSQGSRESREQVISSISRGLKGLAKELEIPIIALSQLNRGVEARARNDKRPLLSDLRESGAIEQDADIIMFIYRDEYYNKESQEPGIAEVIVAKQRNGPTGTVKLLFQGQFLRFSSLAPRENNETYV